MADKAISELIAANQVTPTDLFVLEQSGTAKKLTGQILENWLVSLADGHGGIQSIVKESTSGLVDTYRITLADTTTFDFLVTNGKSINTIAKVSTSGLVDTYRITFNDGTSQTYTVTNGAKGDKGDNQYVWIKYASQEPTAESHSFGDVTDNWIGIYSGESATAPTDWTQYKWFQIKGEKGDTGSPATVISNVVEYQVGDSGTIIPSGAWSSSIPMVAQGRYLWTRTTTTFNSGSSAVSYSVSRMGIDGTGSVSAVAGVSPNADGNVPLTASEVGALPSTGGDLTGELRMNGQPISGLNMPTANDQAANMGFVNQQVKKAAPRNLLDNSDWRGKERIVNQRGQMNYENLSYQFFVDRWKGNNVSYNVGTRIVTVTNSSDGKFYQNVPTDKVTYGKKVTFAVCINGEVFTVNGTFGEYAETANKYSILKIWGGSSSDEAFPFEISFQGQSVGYAVEIDWAALYEGEYTAETLPPYVPKGYGAELAECRRYYQCYDEVACANIDAAYPILGLTFPPMRVTPTLTIGSLVAGDNLVIDGIYVDSASVFKTAVTTLTIGGATGGLVYKARNVALSADL